MITQFQGEYRWLSNFWFFEQPLLEGGRSYPTNEHFYVAMKTTNEIIRQQVANYPLKGVKVFGTTFPLRKDWNQIKLDVMLYGLRHKFSNANPTLRAKLIATGTQEIQEGNYWHDTYWGVDLKTGLGENNLGNLLMQVRDEIINEPVKVLTRFDFA